MQQLVGERALCGGWLLSYLSSRTILRQSRLRKWTCIHLEASCCRYVTCVYTFVVMTLPMTPWNNGKILTDNIPHHYLSRDEQVVVAIVQGKPPKRPDEVAVTDHRWKFIEWCWSPATGAKPRPSSDGIVEFTEKDLTDIMTTEGPAESTAIW